MKIGWEAMSRLVRDVVQKDTDTGQRYSLPERMVAQVKETKKEMALLRWEGKTFKARVDVPVKKGEYLLLHFKGIEEGKRYYQVKARSFEPVIQNGSRYPTQHMLLQNSYGIPFPLIYRYYEDRERKQGANREDDAQKETVVLDFIVETQNLGLIIIRISRKQGCYCIHLLVESEDQGKKLYESLETTQQVLFTVLKEFKLHVKMNTWDLLSPVEKKEILGELFRVSYVLDERV